MIVEYIPSGYTSHLQIIDVAINKLFKDSVCKNVDQCWMDHLLSDRPICQVVSHWIGNSWACNIKETTTEKGWQHIGFSSIPKAHISLNMNDADKSNNNKDNDDNYDNDMETHDEFALDDMDNSDSSDEN